MASGPLEFGPMIEPVARRLLGDPNRSLSTKTELRWGSKGSLSIDLDKGTWFDHEAKDGGGGVLDLIKRERRCGTADALAWLEAEGLKDPRPQLDRRQDKQSESVFYDYTDADGVVSYRVERRGKGHVPPFLQHGPDGRGGYHAVKGCMQGVTRLPYRLPELLAADPDQIIFVVEGEKDADRLAKLGLLATTNSEGAGKFRAELSRHFVGRRVIVIPDNDEPGRAHAADVAAKLDEHAAQVAILALEGPPKGDVSDWLAQGGSAFQLAQRAEEALLRGVETFPVADLRLWASTAPTPKAFFMPHFVPRGEVVIITGDGGTNKSTFALQLALCAAAGTPMLGHDVDRVPALYVTAEDDDRENHWRLSRIAHALGVRLETLAGRLHVSSLRGRLNNELATFDNEGKLKTTPAYALLRATMKRTNSKFVVLDNVAHLFVGNENDRVSVTAFINLLYQICGDFDATLMLIAHRNKIGDNYSGSTAWLNAVRSQIMLERHDENDSDARKLSLGKANYARAGETLEFRWHDFALVRDEDLPRDTRAELAATMQASAENARFMECLDKATSERRNVSLSPAASNFAPKVFAKMPTAKGMKPAAFDAAMQRLLHLGTIAGDQRVFQRENRSWVLGLGPAPTLAPSLHQPPAPTRTSVDHQPARAPVSLSKDTGAASWAGAPENKNSTGARRSGQILAPGESEDDPVPGWED